MNLRDGGERPSSEANISAARRDDPPVSTLEHEKLESPAAPASAEQLADDYVGTNSIIDKYSSEFTDTIHADKSDHAIRSAVIEAYELGKQQPQKERTGEK